MTILVACMVIIGALVLLVVLTSRAMDSDSLLNKWSLASFLWASVCLAVALQASISQEEKGPCLHYETQMHWNAGTKTMMPARVCVSRGEWVKP